MWSADFERDTVAHWQALAWVALQLVGLGLLMRLLMIEGPTFASRLVPLALGGSVVNHLLPRAYRLSFFGLLSLAAIGLLFGFTDGAWILGAGLTLIVLCHLPVAFGVRVALLLGTGTLLAVQRAGLAPSLWSMAVWPIFGSMFMFRLIVYMYDLRHSKQPTRWDERIAYLFAPDEQVVYEEQAEKNARKHAGRIEVLQAFLAWLRPLLEKSVDTAALRAAARVWIQERDLKMPQLYQPLRCVLTGQAGGPDLYDVIAWLGPNRTLRRIEIGTERLS